MPDMFSTRHASAPGMAGSVRHYQRATSNAPCSAPASLLVAVCRCRLVTLFHPLVKAPPRIALLKYLLPLLLPKHCCGLSVFCC